MHTTIDKHPRRIPGDYVNDDGLVWERVFPVPHPVMSEYKYHASIADKRLNHFDFECHGYHCAWANSIEELVEDIKSFGVPYYSDATFLDKIMKKDADDTRDDRQVELHWDGTGTKITRGQLTYNNMTAYTSL